MMKSFFKKLAFVMALAMVVTLAAPAAATAVAATEVKIAYQNGSAVSEVNLAKVGDVEDLKFTGAPDYKEAGFEWTSSNPAVATVDQAGKVTAVAAGTANVTIKIGTDREATVVVNVVDLPTYTATMGLSKEDLKTEVELEVDGTIDLAFFGIKDYDKNRYNCNWYSVDDEVATVDEKGLVTAVAEGKTVISLGVYNVITGQKHKVESCVVTVKGEEVEATPTPVAESDDFTAVQLDTDKFVLTFEDEKTVEEIREGLTVSVKIGEKNYPISFENITVDGKNVTVTTYARFEAGEVYTLTYGECEEEVVIVLGEIKKVGLTYYTGKNKDNNVAYVMEEVEDNDFVTFVPVLYDVYGNDVTAKYNLDNFDFVYEVTGEVGAYPINNDVFSFSKAGVATVDITATWIDEAGTLLTATGKTSFMVEEHPSIVITMEKSGIVNFNNGVIDYNQNIYGDDRFTYINDAVISFQTDANSAVWGHGSFTTLEYMTNDQRVLYYTAVLKDNRGNVVTSNTTDYKFGTFSYESTNNEVLTIADTTGEVDLLKQGTANILVYFTPADGTTTKKLVGSTRIVVTPETYPVRYEVTSSNTTASHVVDGDLNDAYYTITVYDQNGDKYNGYYVNDIASLFTIEARDTNNTVIPTIWSNGNGTYGFMLDGSSFADALATIAEDGTVTTINNSKQYSYKLTLEKSDITKNVATQFGVFSLTVLNTAKEYVILKDFVQPGAVLSEANKNYKFNISIDKSKSQDLAVKNVNQYWNQWAAGKTKSQTFKAKYLSNAGAPLAYIPADKFVENTTNMTTGNAGYVYYKVSAPSKVMFEGASVDNDFYSFGITDGKLTFTFNEVVDGVFKYAATGSYGVTYATTRTNGGNIYGVGSSTVSVTNSQNQVKYVGLNPELEGITEQDIFVGMSDAAIEAIIKEQLLFSYDELALGEYYDLANGWLAGTVTLDLDHAKTNVTVSKDGKSIIVSTLAFDVTVDDGTGAYTYKSIISVGARIKEK